MRFSEDKLDSLTCSDGVNRTIHIWEATPPAAVIVAVHGAMAHAGDFVTPALYFKAQRYTTVSFDMHGHDGKQKTHIPAFDVFLDDLDLMLHWTNTQYPDLPIFLMGHSMGALILTHFGLRRLTPAAKVRGVIMSSPWFVNAVKVPPVLESMAGVLATVLPTMKVPAEDIRDYLTHDKIISNRHYADEADHIRASAVTMRFANECLKAQRFLPDNISQWSHPLIAVIAGDDKLADSSGTHRLLDKIDQSLLTRHDYPENFHENFNELNRDEIFAEILNWMQKRI